MVRLFALFTCTLILVAACGAPRDSILDSSYRAPTRNVVVFRQTPERPYRVIAKLYERVDPRLEGDPLGEIILRARRLGADGLILQPSLKGQKFGLAKPYDPYCIVAEAITFR